MILNSVCNNSMHLKLRTKLMLNSVISFLLVMLSSFTRKFSSKMVLVVRMDLKMSQGKIAAQCSHAAVSLYASCKSSTRLNLWFYAGQPKIVLKADSDCILRSLYEQAKCKNLNVCLVHDAGRTQIEKGSLTVLGIGPNESQKIDEITKNLKLF